MALAGSATFTRDLAMSEYDNIYRLIWHNTWRQKERFLGIFNHESLLYCTYVTVPRKPTLNNIVATSMPAFRISGVRTHEAWGFAGRTRDFCVYRFSAPVIIFGKKGIIRFLEDAKRLNPSLSIVISSNRYGGKGSLGWLLKSFPGVTLFTTPLPFRPQKVE